VISFVELEITPMLFGFKDNVITAVVLFSIAFDFQSEKAFEVV